MDFQVNRLREPPPPPHLRDLGLAQLAENHGRERRYKYFTDRHYVQAAEREQLEPPFPDAYFDHVGEFMPIDQGQFYEDAEDLNKCINGISETLKETKPPKPRKSRKKKVPAVSGEKPKRVRKRKLEEATAGEPASESASAVPKKRARPRKHPPPEDAAGEGAIAEGSTSAPIVPKKRGRPRKHPLPEEGAASAPLAPKKRGHPRKHPLPDSMNVDHDGSAAISVPETSQGPLHDDSASTGVSATVPPQDPSSLISPTSSAPDDLVVDDSVASESVSAIAAKEKRGRSRKHPLPETADVTGALTVASAPPLLPSASDEDAGMYRP